MFSTKAQIGHALGAAGVLEAVACVGALQSGFVHPNINLDAPEAELDVNFIVGKVKEEMRPSVALSNSFGFGGHNSAVVFKKCTGA